jgi:hypothetical protein
VDDLADTLILFPPSRAATTPRRLLALAPLATPRRASDIDVAGVAELLFMARRPPRFIVAMIRLLVEKEGFPAPRSLRFVAGRRMTGADAVWTRSIWERDAVERWLDEDLPPTQAAAKAANDRAATRTRLGERAKLIVCGRDRSRAGGE